ncbi:hypothetical protein Y032_0227g2819 [Ancylostoma ceylanicum]|uniref:Uncharacterized protein n=1 Tax=Ancylostoma ceylanicum TaxID=53326 RepID=A0A016SHQ1_9BILA|nr:hypothetical protein Y032_0227g2819 [Ancylostoma ceylanicum]
MAKYFRKFFTLAVNDLANQYAIPAKSLTGYVLTKYCARRTDRLNKAVVDSLNIQKAATHSLSFGQCIFHDSGSAGIEARSVVGQTVDPRSIRLL